MAVHSASNDPTLPLIATDPVGAYNYQQVKLDVGKTGVSLPVTNPYPWHPVGYGDSMGVDAFGRLRVSNPSTLFESSFEYDLQPTWFEPVKVGGGTVTWDSNKRSAILAVSTGATDSAFLQTRQYWPYEKGKSRFVKITGALGTAVANVRRRVGYFDGANGVFLEQTSAALSWTIRSSVSGSVSDANTVTQANWNIDPLDGSGPSGITFDPTKGFIIAIDFQFLGTGRVRCGFNIDGVFVPAHQFLNANRNAVIPYMQTATLPIRWEIANTSASAGASLQAVCCDVESDGGQQDLLGYYFAAANTSDVATSGTRAQAISIRPAVTFNGIVNRMAIIPGAFDAIVASANTLVEVYYNCTVTGGSWGSAGAFSGVEVGTGQSISALGILVQTMFVPTGGGQVRGFGSEQIGSDYPITLDSTGANPRNLTVCVTALSSSGTARCELEWKEIR